ncbi:MAG: ATP-grasp domain-containing protein [Candidatus Thorarchaeota archaeon]
MATLITEHCWLVIGFNGRPIVESLNHYLGKKEAPIAAVDYFADIETRACAKHLFSVIKQEIGERSDRIFHRSPGDYLTELAEILTDEIPVGTILLGSGMDDRPDLWRRIASLGKLKANDSDKLAMLRNRAILFEKAKKVGLRVPKYQLFTTLSEFEATLSKFEFPCIVRREGGAGGLHIFKCFNEADAIQAAHSLLTQFGKAIIESFEGGLPASVSILGTAEQAMPLAFNEQLIGCKSSFCPSSFGFCGNITPLQLPSESLDLLTEQFTRLGEQLQLIGTNGFDFVLKNGEACVFELNPRFQGSLEPIEQAYDINLVEAHLNCFAGHLPDIPARKGVAVRKILYAPKQITVPELPPHLAKDRPLPGVIISQGSPYVSVVAQGQSRGDMLQQLAQKEELIWKKTGM